MVCQEGNGGGGGGGGGGEWGTVAVAYLLLGALLHTPRFDLPGLFPFLLVLHPKGGQPDEGASNSNFFFCIDQQSGASAQKNVQPTTHFFLLR